MTALCAIGLMSGTSMDGIDAAMIRTDGETVTAVGPKLFVPYDAAFRRRIEAGLDDARAIRSRDERPGALAAIEEEITARHAEAVHRLMALDDSVGAARFGPVDVVGFHGQTVLHRPQDGLTVQLGDGARLARNTGLTVVHDMRAADMRAGGQGAPLVPAYHAALARSLTAPHRGMFPVVFANIGGISNITFVPESGAPVAFDTGPGNALIDRWVSREGGIPFDADGVLASEGDVARAVVAAYLSHPFFEKSGPKSLDRNDFDLEPVAGLELADGARTLAAVSAEALLAGIANMPLPPRLWIVCGGGRRNPHIVGDLRAGAERDGASVILAEDAGLDGDFTEAEAWRFLAVRSLKRLALTFPTTTGCRAETTGGVISPAPERAAAVAESKMS